MHDISHGGDTRHDAVVSEYDANAMVHFEFSKRFEKYDS